MSEPDNLFPGFKVSPLDPSRDVRPSFKVTPQPENHDPSDDYDPDDCFCGGDLCVCTYNGEKPCWSCI